jgi:chromosome partitioning protein
MPIIAVANQKGGTAKTVTSVNLAASLASYGKTVLLVDLDAQATATRHLIGRYGDDGSVVSDVLMKRATLRSTIVETDAGVALVPSNLSLASLDIDLLSEYNREHRLENALSEPNLPPFDYVIIDCPPNLGFPTVNAFVACDICIIPIECKAEAWEAVPRLMTALKRVVSDFRKSMRIYALPTFLERTNLARDIHEQIEEHFENLTLPPIHKNTKLAEAFAARQPILKYDPTASGALDYLRVAKEILDAEATAVRRGVERRPGR